MPRLREDEKVKENEILHSSLHKESDSIKSLKIKAGIQDFINDFAFVIELLEKEESV